MKTTSPRCYNRLMKKAPRQVKPCENCHKLFPRPRSYRIKNDAWVIRKYCSRKCMGEARKKRIILICVYCGKKYEEIETRRSRSTCCSRRCADLNKRRRQFITCDICGKKKEVRTSDLKRGNGKHCSRQCLYKYLSKKYLGSGGNGWRGGVSNLQQLIRHTREYRAWRSGVFRRDGWKCIICGSQKEIQADHYPRPLSFYISKIFNRYNTNTQRLICLKKNSKVWDTNNGRTLCQDCHKKTPTYGNSIHARNLQASQRFV